MFPSCHERPREWASTATFILVLAACVGLTIALHAQIPDESATRPTYALSGTVVNSVTGEPIPHALVQLFAGPQRSVLTDSEGRFGFESLPPGQFMATARKPGFFSQQELSPEAYSSGLVKIGPEASAVVLKLVPEGVIFGHVIGANDEPLEGFQVVAEFPRIINGRKQWEQRGGESTNAAGAFRIANLVPGPYYLRVEPGWSRNAITTVPDGQGYRPEYYPGVDDVADATPLNVQSGQKVQADFSLAAEPVFAIAGVVSGYKPDQGVWLELTSRGASGPRPVVGSGYSFGPAGVFKFGSVPAGSYILRAHANTADNRMLEARVPLNLRSNLADLRLFLQPTASIPVIVRQEATHPVEEARGVIIRNGALGNVTVHLIALDHGNNDGYATFEGAPPALAVRNAEPGKYSVTITPNYPWYVQSAVSGTTDLLNEDLVVPASGAPAPIEIVLRDDGGSIGGTVQAEEGLNRATIIAVPDRKFADPLTAQIAERRTPFQSQGAADQFQFNGLAPGDYDLLALDRVDGLEYTNPEVLREYLSHGVRVTLHAGEKKTVSLELITRGQP